MHLVLYLFVCYRHVKVSRNKIRDVKRCGLVIDYSLVSGNAGEGFGAGGRGVVLVGIRRCLSPEESPYASLLGLSQGRNF